MAEAIAHPFGHDEDDFQIGELISRHIWVLRFIFILTILWIPFFQATGKLLSQCGGPPAQPDKKKLAEAMDNVENSHVESL